MSSVASSMKFSLLAIFLLAASVMVLAQADDQITTGDLSSAHVKSLAVAPRGHRNG